ncbi:MAG: hybrid sensor histidine kinase/response regulator, partial [Planctomycetes bacterium]|nr:hybrid sensor histidine kinase/response regulator [Planctomycetota bacterium]
PGLTGPELARRLTAERPGLRALFMSGYLEVGSFPDELRHPGAPFLQKPFGPAALARKVRDVLDAGGPAGA